MNSAHTTLDHKTVENTVALTNAWLMNNSKRTANAVPAQTSPPCLKMAAPASLSSANQINASSKTVTAKTALPTPDHKETTPNVQQTTVALDKNCCAMGHANGVQIMRRDKVMGGSVDLILVSQDKNWRLWVHVKHVILIHSFLKMVGLVLRHCVVKGKGLVQKESAKTALHTLDHKMMEKSVMQMSAILIKKS